MIYRQIRKIYLHKPLLINLHIIKILSPMVILCSNKQLFLKWGMVDSQSLLPWLNSPIKMYIRTRLNNNNSHFRTQEHPLLLQVTLNHSKPMLNHSFLGKLSISQCHQLVWIAKHKQMLLSKCKMKISSIRVVLIYR
jgi:hypothetical protein